MYINISPLGIRSWGGFLAVFKPTGQEECSRKSLEMAEGNAEAAKEELKGDAVVKN